MFERQNQTFVLDSAEYMQSTPQLNLLKDVFVSSVDCELLSSILFMKNILSL